VITMEKDIRRMLLFFRREAFMVVMERESGSAIPTLAPVFDCNRQSS
jgi:hypothetical protein